MSSTRASNPPAQPQALPDRPNLEHLHAQARTLQRGVRYADPAALATVVAFDPGAPELAAHESFSLSAAQRVLARSYGFASWRRLRERVATIATYSRWPQPPDAASTADERQPDPDTLLRSGCLNYTRDDAGVLTAARRMLSAQPALAAANLYTAAAAGDAGAVRRLLADAASPLAAVNATGGPFDWPPLLYLAYSRLGDGPGRSALDTARVLLDAGADPNAGYLWQGMTSPFTALTGAFGGGEASQPVHPDALALARLLLDAGADPNDNQALYNRMFTPSNEHLELLLRYGLGTVIASPWRDRLGDSYPSPEQMVGEQLRWAADYGLTDRVRLLLAHGVAPDNRGYHPNYGDATAYRLAVLAGNRRIAGMLADAGAAIEAAALTPADEFTGACLAADRAEVRRLQETDPGLPAAVLGRPHQGDQGTSLLVTAARLGRPAAVELLLDLGAEIDQSAAADGRTALHQAAWDGSLDIVELLVDRGADATLRDRHHDATALGWAQHAGHTKVAEWLRVRTGSAGE